MFGDGGFSPSHPSLLAGTHATVSVPHFLFIQNADDNAYPPHVLPGIEFDASPRVVIVRNNELGFMPKHVRALCHVGASSKGKGAKGYIGQKGIGFKSVFRVSGAPEVHSRGFHFSLDQFMVVPHALPPSASLWLRQIKRRF